MKLGVTVLAVLNIEKKRLRDANFKACLLILPSGTLIGFTCPCYQVDTVINRW